MPQSGRRSGQGRYSTNWGTASTGTSPVVEGRAGGRECDPPADRASLMGVGDMPVLWGR